MNRMNIVKWAAAGALAIAVAPAIGMARHSHTVTAAASPNVLIPVKHTLAAKTRMTPSKLVSHKKAASTAKKGHRSKAPAKHHAKKSTSKKHLKKKH